MNSINTRSLNWNVSARFFTINKLNVNFTTLAWLVVISMVVYGQTAKAQLAAWDVNGLTGFGPSPFDATTVANNFTVDGLTRGSGVLITQTPASNAWGGNGFEQTTLANAISTGDYATFSITANGYAFSLSGIAAYNIRRSGTGPTTGRWQYQRGTGAFVDITSDITWGGTTSASGNAQTAITLSGITALQNIPSGTTITFRLATWGGASTGTWYINNISGNDLALNGTQGVQCPSSLSYTDNPAIYTQNTAITTNSATHGGGTTTVYSVSPALPAGLALSATTGAITGIPTATTAATNYTVTTTNACGSTTTTINITVEAAVLPVELVSFTAKTTDLKSAFLSFSTASERNNSHFEIERSTDAQTFTQIGRVAGAGTSDATQNYTFTDLKPARGANYYRLKQVDFDGNFSYSMIRTVEFGKSGSLLVFPSPTAETMNIQLDEPFATDAQWQIIDLAGRIVSTGNLAGEQQVYQIPVSMLMEGVYVLRLMADQQVLTQEFVKK